MAHLPQRWLGIVLRTVRGYYPEGELAAWGPMVEGDELSANGGARRLELVVLRPHTPDPGDLASIRRDLERSDLPVECDLRAMGDLTMREQEEVLERGVHFGGP
ncbi:MAG: hypothetical protein PF508_19905 [Spirochaeta sp.]|nr:hypothetical protein [Spirochaeta sp.]